MAGDYAVDDVFVIRDEFLGFAGAGVGDFAEASDGLFKRRGGKR